MSKRMFEPIKEFFERFRNSVSPIFVAFEVFLFLAIVNISILMILVLVITRLYENLGIRNDNSDSIMLIVTIFLTVFFSVLILTGGIKFAQERLSKKNRKSWFQSVKYIKIMSELTFAAVTLWQLVSDTEPFKLKLIRTLPDCIFEFQTVNYDYSIWFYVIALTTITLIFSLFINAEVDKEDVERSSIADYEKRVAELENRVFELENGKIFTLTSKKQTYYPRRKYH